MTLLNQMAGGKPGTVTVVERHAAFLKPGNDAVDDHHTGDLLHQMNEFGVGDHFGMDNQCRAAVADQLLNSLAFFLFIVIAIADQQKIPGLIRNLLNRFHHGAEKRIRDITHNQPDGFS